MIILGIDPGIARCGWGVIKTGLPAGKAGTKDEIRAANYGCIQTDSKSSLPDRLRKIYRELKKIIQEGKPSCLVMEKLFFAQNVKTAIVVGQSQGVILLAADDFGIPVFEYTPLQVKQALTGQGRAMKTQVQKMVKLCLNLPVVQGPDDVSDALAVALCHLHSQNMNHELARINPSPYPLPQRERIKVRVKQKNL